MSVLGLGFSKTLFSFMMHLWTDATYSLKSTLIATPASLLACREQPLSAIFANDGMNEIKECYNFDLLTSCLYVFRVLPGQSPEGLVCHPSAEQLHPPVQPRPGEASQALQRRQPALAASGPDPAGSDA